MNDTVASSVIGRGDIGVVNTVVDSNILTGDHNIDGNTTGWEHIISAVSQVGGNNVGTAHERWSFVGAVDNVVAENARQVCVVCDLNTFESTL